MGQISYSWLWVSALTLLPTHLHINCYRSSTSQSYKSKAQEFQVHYSFQMSSTSPRQFSSRYSIFSTPPSLPNIFAILFVYAPLIYLFATLSLILLFNIQSSSLPPGPWYTYFTNIVLRYHEWNGNRRLYIHKLHGKYGDAVRIGVREFSFCGREGVKGVYGCETEGGRGEKRLELDKTGFYGLFRQLGVRTVFSTEARVEVSCHFPSSFVFLFCFV